MAVTEKKDKKEKKEKKEKKDKKKDKKQGKDEEPEHHPGPTEVDLPPDAEEESSDPQAIQAAQAAETSPRRDQWFQGEPQGTKITEVELEETPADPTAAEGPEQEQV